MCTAWCVHIPVYVCIHLLCLSIIVNRLLLLLLGPIICWLPSNWPRTVVFGSGAVHRDFGVFRGRSGLGPLGTNGQLKLPYRECLFHSVYLCMFIFQYMQFPCCSSNTPCHTVFISSVI